MTSCNRLSLLQVGSLLAAQAAIGRRSAALMSAGLPVEGRDMNAFEPPRLGEVLPEGWLKAQLTVKANGMGGHLDEFWPNVGPNSEWLGGIGQSWERGPYFVDGLFPLAVALQDDTLREGGCSVRLGGGCLTVVLSEGADHHS